MRVKYLVYGLVSILILIGISFLFINITSTSIVLGNPEPSVQQPLPQNISEYYNDLGAKTITLSGFILTVVALFFAIINLFIYSRSESTADKVDSMIDDLKTKVKTNVEESQVKIENYANKTIKEINLVAQNIEKYKNQVKNEADKSLKDISGIADRVKNEFENLKKTFDQYEQILQLTNNIAKKFLLERILAQAIQDEYTLKIERMRKIASNKNVDGELSKLVNSILEIEEHWLGFTWGAFAISCNDSNTRCSAILHLGSMVRNNEQAKFILREIFDNEIFEKNSDEGVSLKKAIF
jgi:hypothetical protein